MRPPIASKLRSLALEVLDFDGCYDVTYQYETGGDDLNGVPLQAFVVIRRGALLGMDCFGGVWSGTSWRSTIDEVAFRVTLDPRPCNEEITVPDATGQRSREPQTHVVVGRQLAVEDRLSFDTSLAAGGLRIAGRMLRKGTFDVAHY